MQHEILHPIVKNARITVMPTYIDTAPSASLETMSNGGVLLASNNSSIEEYVKNNKNGFLFENGKANSLKKKILEILKIPDFKINKIRKNSQRDIKKNFSKKKYN